MAIIVGIFFFGGCNDGLEAQQGFFSRRLFGRSWDIYMMAVALRSVGGDIMGEVREISSWCLV